jgi:hypothetical protein
VGWVDLDSGDRTIELPELAEAFKGAVEAWRRSHSVVGRLPSGPGSELESARTTRLGFDKEAVGAKSRDGGGAWVDLAGNRPGAGVRAKAIELRRSEPVWTLLARVAGVHTEERAWRVGARGEELVGKELAKLGPDWRVLHSVPLGDHGPDVDHLVIGAGGVFTLNAKNHKYAAVSVNGDLVTVNGYPQLYVQKSRHEARRVGHILSDALGVHIPTRGVVVIANAGHFSIRERPCGVQVIDKRGLRRFLRSLPRLYD